MKFAPMNGTNLGKWNRNECETLKNMRKLKKNNKKAESFKYHGIIVAESPLL